MINLQPKPSSRLLFKRKRVQALCKTSQHSQNICLPLQQRAAEKIVGVPQDYVWTDVEIFLLAIQKKKKKERAAFWDFYLHMKGRKKRELWTGFSTSAWSFYLHLCVLSYIVSGSSIQWGTSTFKWKVTWNINRIAERKKKTPRYSTWVCRDISTDMQIMDLSSHSECRNPPAVIRWVDFRYQRLSGRCSWGMWQERCRIRWLTGDQRDEHGSVCARNLVFSKHSVGKVTWFLIM